MAAHSLLTSPAAMNRPEFKQFNPFSTAQVHIRRCEWLGTKSFKPSVPSLNLRPFILKQSPINATISFSLPTSKPDRAALSEKIPKWSSMAIKSFAMGELEARKIKSPTTDTEALLMGILVEGTSLASKYLRANGITLLKVRDEIFKLRGKPDMYFFSPEHPPLTEAAQKALDCAIDEKLKAGESGEITTLHILLGLWQQEKSPGHQVLIALGFTDDKAKELHSLILEPGCIED